MRIAKVVFKKEFLEAILSKKPGYALEVVGGIPEGSSLVRIKYDTAQKWWEAIFQHESFPVYAEGGPIPVIDVKARLHKLEVDQKEETNEVDNSG